MKVVIFPIEPIESRYTCEWYEHLPQAIRQYAQSRGMCGRVQVIQLDGVVLEANASTGAFLNFNSTNYYKSSQLMKFVSEVMPTIQDEDVILFTDAWNPCAIQVKYMLQLAGKKTRMCGMWHAGSYDPEDFLGRAFDKGWSCPFESALASLYDTNYFATQYHRSLFSSSLILDPERSEIVGWPMEYLKDKIKPGAQKENLVLFPHRISTEKCPEVFNALAARFSHKYKFVRCQDQSLTKAEYHELLRKAKVVFSASRQETLGIGVYEGLLAGAAPLMPRRLSYKEIWSGIPPFLYRDPGRMEMKNIEYIGNVLETLMDQDEQRNALVDLARMSLKIESFYNGEALYRSLLGVK